MAASIDLTSGGTGGPGDLDTLVKALDRFTLALQGVAKGIGGGGDAPQEGGQPQAQGQAPGMGLSSIAGMFTKFLPPQMASFATTVTSVGETLAQFAQKMKLSSDLAAKMASASDGVAKFSENVADGADSAGKLPGVSTAITTAIGTFGTKLASAGAGLVRLLGPIGIGAGIFMLAKKLPILGDLMEIGIQGVLYPLRSMGSIFSETLLPLNNFKEKAGVVASAMESLGKVQYAYSQSLSNSTQLVSSTVKGGMERVTAVLTNPLQELPKLVSEIRPFVEAFNPVVMQEFDQAMKTVMAVIGEALVPVVRVAAALLREFAGYLRPIMRQLEPIISEVAKTVGSFLKEIMPLLPEFINSLLPVIKNYGEMLKENIGAMTAYNKGQFSLLDKVRYKLSEWTGGLISKPKFEAAGGGLPPGVQKENISNYGAASAPTFKGTADLGKDLMQAAFIARPGELVDDTAKQTADNTAKAADLLEQLVDVNKASQTYDARVAEGGATGFFQWAAGQTAEGIYNFGVGATNLLTGNNLQEGMVDI